MTLAERRAMLFNPDFWRVLSRQMPLFANEQELQMLAALAKSTKVSPERARAHYDRYLYARHVIRKHLTHPGTSSIH